jgi:predicted transcriptional regulator
MRGAVIKALVAQGPGDTDEIKMRTGIVKKDLYKVLEALEKEAMVAEKAGKYRIKE